MHGTISRLAPVFGANRLASALLTVSRYRTRLRVRKDRAPVRHCWTPRGSSGLDGRLSGACHYRKPSCPSSTQPSSRPSASTSTTPRTTSRGACRRGSLADLAEMSSGGLRAVAYLNQATGELVMALPGADELRSAVHESLLRHRDRRHAFNARSTSSRRRARKPRSGERARSLNDGDVTLTGHGVGGGFASLLSVATGLTAVTFNGCGSAG